VRAYIDDFACVFQPLLDRSPPEIGAGFKRLKSAGIKINAKKSFFGKRELEYLGYWITREGIQPM